MRSAHLFRPSFGSLYFGDSLCFSSLRRRAKRVLSADGALAGEIVNKGSTHLRGTYSRRKASPSAGIDSLLGAIAQRLGDRVSPRARPCLRAWSIQMDCSVCRSACGLTRRDKNPASAEGSRALSRETRVVSNGRRLRAVLVGIRTTACSPDMLKYAIVRVKRRTRDLIVQTHRRRLKNVTAFAKITMYVLHAYRYHALPHTLRVSFLTGR